MIFNFEELKKEMIPYFVSLVKNDVDEYCANDFYRFVGVPVPFIGDHNKFNGFSFGAMILDLDMELVYRIAGAD